MNKYIYDGPVMYFDALVEDKWHGETLAVSAKKARSNLSYKWKVENGYSRNAMITLPGKIKIDDYGKQLTFEM